MKTIGLMLLLSIFIIVLFPTGMRLDNHKSDEEILISKALSSKQISLLTLSLKRNVFNEINGKRVNYDLLNINFLSNTELLNHTTTNFYSASVNIKNNTAVVVINYFKSGLMFIFNYTKRNEKWMETSSEWGITKFEPSKAYYIYLENMRLTNPDYKNYDIRMIPRDSLK
ncbi:hypothetical protein G6R40_02835 [Chryseobacterium sp. POL2]|uniref:hypothetical protein n=1 Tax=Chryseobacterium sp. POL2 TaxID=2713414 RepID=UPI0013E1F414|nr:hypothetical protein [Chryseobacterium sp. POL2]QIG88667.1 hypothetical protein G6R40_02835 [Chryseobacterium sp. POL2]